MALLPSINDKVPSLEWAMLSYGLMGAFFPPILDKIRMRPHYGGIWRIPVAASMGVAFGAGLHQLATYFEEKGERKKRALFKELCKTQDLHMDRFNKGTLPPAVMEEMRKRLIAANDDGSVNK